MAHLGLFEAGKFNYRIPAVAGLCRIGVLQGRQSASRQLGISEVRARAVHASVARPGDRLRGRSGRAVRARRSRGVALTEHSTRRFWEAGRAAIVLPPAVSRARPQNHARPRSLMRGASAVIVVQTIGLTLDCRHPACCRPTRMKQRTDSPPVRAFPIQGSSVMMRGSW